MAFIEVEHLKYRYPGAKKLALDDISFTVEKGEFIGLLGENGAGKSSLSQALLGLIPQFYKGAYGGTVRIDGLEAAKTPVGALCQKIGLVFQNPFNQLSGAKDTVFDEVGYGLQNLGIAPEEIRRRVESVLRQLGIWEFRDRNPFDLSGGQLQRVAIASVLAMQPELLILDEPTSQLDPAGSEEVFRIVEELAKTGITILMIEQKPEKLAAYCDRLLLMQGGKLLAIGTPEEIFSREDLAERHVEPPVYTSFAREHGLRLPNGCYPVTLSSLLGTMSSARRAELRTSLTAAPEKAPAASSSAALTESFRTENLKFSYIPGRPVLPGLSLTLDHRPTAIIGQNGAGKTTLVRILKGLLKPESGSVYFGGEDITRHTVAALSGRIGYVFQNPDDQIFKYKVLDEVMFGPLNIGMPKEKAEESARQALQQVGLSAQAESNPYDLELSERKLVAIASVLAMDTEVVILDEPTIAQDVLGKAKLREIVAALQARGKLVLAILHDMDFVAACFERVLVMAHGEILADGSPAEVFRETDALKEAAVQPPQLYKLRDELINRAQRDVVH